MKKLAILLSCIMLLSCVVFQPAYAKTTAPTDGLVIYYNFDENVNDQKGNNSFDAVDSSRYVDGVLGKAISFTGVQADVLNTGWRQNLTKVTETGSFTFSTWYKAPNGTPEAGKDGAFFTRGSYANNSGNWLFIQGGSGNIGTSCSPNYPYYWLWQKYDREQIEQELVDVYGVGNNVDVCDGKWHNIVATYDVSTKTFAAYIDGFCYNKCPSFYTNPTLDIGPHDNYLVIGGRGNDSYLNGYMDDVRFYDHALSAAEVNAIYGMVDPAVAVADAFASGSADGGYYTAGAAYAPIASAASGELVFTAAFNTDYLTANAKSIVKAGLTIYASKNAGNQDKWKKGEAEVSALLSNDGCLTVTVTGIDAANFGDNVVAIPYILLSNGTVLSAAGASVTTKCVNDFSTNWLGMADN